MGNLIKLNRSIIEPIYSQADPNQSLNLGDFKVQLSFKEKIYLYTANLIMQFMPNSQLLFTIPFIDGTSQFPIGFSHEDEWDGKITLIESGVYLDGILKSRSFGSDGKGRVTLIPKISVVPAMQPSNAISSAVFHLFNFPNFIGPEDYIYSWESGSKRCGRIILKADGWTITIAATDKTDSIVKSLESQNGYAITHMGKVAREDSSVFSSEELEDILQCIHYFLSFTLGRWRYN